VLRFNQDPLNPTKTRLGEDGMTGKLISGEESGRHERAAV
jgi:hypothetical protein